MTTTAIQMKIPICAPLLTVPMPFSTVCGGECVATGSVGESDWDESNTVIFANGASVTTEPGKLAYVSAERGVSGLGSTAGLARVGIGALKVKRGVGGWKRNEVPIEGNPLSICDGIVVRLRVVIL